MHSYNNETGILEVLEIKIFFAAQAQLKDLYRFFLKFVLWVLQFNGGLSVSFLKTKRVTNL